VIYDETVAEWPGLARHQRKLDLQRLEGSSSRGSSLRHLGGKGGKGSSEGKKSSKSGPSSNKSSKSDSSSKKGGFLLRFRTIEPFLSGLMYFTLRTNTNCLSCIIAQSVDSSSEKSSSKKGKKPKTTTREIEPITGLDLSRAYRDTIQQEGLYKHCAMFQSIADATGGIRAAGTRGYIKSMEYVAKKLIKAGYNVYYTNVIADYFAERSPAVLDIVASATPIDFATPPNDPRTYYTYPGTAHGVVEAMVEAVDVNYTIVNATTESTSGCEVEDFANFTAGRIALMMRGTCSFLDKIDMAVQAGAVGVILTNSGTVNNTNATSNRFRRNVDVPSFMARPC
jgi:hypothetical protein